MAKSTTDLRRSILYLFLLSGAGSHLAACFLQSCILFSAVVQSQTGLAVVPCLIPQAAFYSALGTTERSLHCKGLPLAAWAEQLREPHHESEHGTLQS